MRKKIEYSNKSTKLLFGLTRHFHHNPIRIHSYMFSPKRLSASLDDMRRKAIAKRISRDLTRGLEHHTHAGLNPSVSKLEPLANHLASNKPITSAPHKEEYILIPEQDMSFATEKQCKELDIYNDTLYKKSYKLYQEIMAKLSGTNLELKQTPQPPPNPNNLHRLYHYRQRNRETNCLRQTAAVCYLVKQGYQLSANNTFSGSLTAAHSHDIKIFEPYQAIELATNLSASRQENYLDAAQELFEKLGIHDHAQDTQHSVILQKSELPSAPPPAFNQEYTRLYPDLYSGNLAHQTSIESSYQQESSYHLEPDMMVSAKLSYYPVPDRRATAPAKLLPTNTRIQNGLECQNPEHHSVPEKIKYFDDTTNNSSTNL